MFNLQNTVLHLLNLSDRHTQKKRHLDNQTLFVSLLDKTRIKKKKKVLHVSQQLYRVCSACFDIISFSFDKDKVYDKSFYESLKQLNYTEEGSHRLVLKKNKRRHDPPPNKLYTLIAKCNLS